MEPLTHSQLTRFKSYLVDLFRDKEAYVTGDLENISNGWESEMYALEVAFNPGTSARRRRLVLRIYPGDDAEQKSRREFDHIRKLQAIGYPVPRVLDHQGRHSVIDRPFIMMEWIEGSVMWSQLEAAAATKKKSLLKLFSSLFVDLHELDWRPFVEKEEWPYFEDPHYWLDSWLELAKGAIRQYAVDELLPLLDWLRDRRDEIPCRRPSPTHGDFHPGNIMIRDDGSAVVLDWTGFSVTDCRVDLGWTSMLIEIYLGREIRDEIIEEYSQKKGGTIERLEIFEVIAYGRRLFDIFVSLTEGAQRLGMRPEAVSAMQNRMDATWKVYELLVQRTGITLPKMEAVFARNL